MVAVAMVLPAVLGALQVGEMVVTVPAVLMLTNEIEVEVLVVVACVFVPVLLVGVGVVV